MSNRNSHTEEWTDLGNPASLKWRCRKHTVRIHVPVDPQAAVMHLELAGCCCSPPIPVTLY